MKKVWHCKSGWQLTDRKERKMKALVGEMRKRNLQALGRMRKTGFFYLSLPFTAILLANKTAGPLFPPD